MTDITKCNGRREIETRVHTCPLRLKCRRYLAPSGPWQSWFTDTPLEINEQGDVSCTYLMRSSKENER